MESKVFSCNLGDVRVIVNDSEPLFCAYDVCRILDYKNGRDTIKRLFGGCVAKYYAGVEIGKKPDGTPIIQDREMTFLTEPQLYKLIMRSNAKNAENIQKWICDEVMPSVKGGGFEVFPQSGENPSGGTQSVISFDNVEVETYNSIVSEIYNETTQLDIKVFQFEMLDVEVIFENDLPFFKITDIEKTLGLSKGASYQWLKEGWFDDDEVKLRISQLGGHPIKYVAESGLYRILNRSNSEKARPFERFVTKEVLPSIRKNGKYEMPLNMSDPKVLLNQVIELAQKQLVLIEENEKLAIENKEQKQLIEYQGDNLNSYKQVEKAGRSKAELKATFNRKVRLLAEQKFNRDYPRAYQFVYGIFANTHNITEKINMAYIGKNIDYLAECVEIVLSELD